MTMVRPQHHPIGKEFIWKYFLDDVEVSWDVINNNGNVKTCNSVKIPGGYEFRAYTHRQEER